MAGPELYGRLLEKAGQEWSTEMFHRQDEPLLRWYSDGILTDHGDHYTGDDLVDGTSDSFPDEAMDEFLNGVIELLADELSKRYVAEKIRPEDMGVAEPGASYLGLSEDDLEVDEEDIPVR